MNLSFCGVHFCKHVRIRAGGEMLGLQSEYSKMYIISKKWESL